VRLMEIAARLLMAGTTCLQLWIAHRHVAARRSVFDYIAEVFLLLDCMRRRCCGTYDRQQDQQVFLECTRSAIDRKRKQIPPVRLRPRLTDWLL
jgi:hypothetical protein